MSITKAILKYGDTRARTAIRSLGEAYRVARILHGRPLTDDEILSLFNDELRLYPEPTQPVVRADQLNSDDGPSEGL